MIFLNLLGDNDLGYRLFVEFFTNAYSNYNLKLNFYNRIYFGRNDFEIISPSHFSFYWEGYYYFKNFFVYYIHNCENGIDKNAYDNRRWDLFGIGMDVKKFNILIGHVVSPFRTSYDNQNYTWGFNIKGSYKFLDIYYLLIYTQDNKIKHSFSLKLNYPIYLGFERRMDVKSIYDRKERDFYILGLSYKKPFKNFEFYNLFRFNLEPSYNVLYIAKFGYNFLDFEIEGLSAKNRWTPEFLIFDIYLCKELCIKWFSKHQLDLNYLNNNSYIFDNTKAFPFTFSIGYYDNNFGFFYAIFERNFQRRFEIIINYKTFSYKIYFDEQFSIKNAYNLSFHLKLLKDLSFIIGVFRNDVLDFNNVFFGVYLSKK